MGICLIKDHIILALFSNPKAPAPQSCEEVYIIEDAINALKKIKTSWKNFLKEKLMQQVQIRIQQTNAVIMVT